MHLVQGGVLLTPHDWNRSEQQFGASTELLETKLVAGVKNSFYETKKHILDYQYKDIVHN